MKKHFLLLIFSIIALDSSSVYAMELPSDAELSDDTIAKMLLGLWPARVPVVQEELPRPDSAGFIEYQASPEDQLKREQRKWLNRLAQASNNPANYQAVAADLLILLPTIQDPQTQKRALNLLKVVQDKINPQPISATSGRNLSTDLAIFSYNGN